MIGGLVTAIILHAIGADIHHYEAAHNNTRLPLLIYYWGRMLSMSFEENSLIQPVMFQDSVRSS